MLLAGGIQVPARRRSWSRAPRQETKLAWIEKTHPCLWRAYLLKEGLRTAFKLKGEEGKHALARWLSWAARCRIPNSPN
jgi:transposase